MGENRKAIGFDVGSDPVRLAALERARDTGKPTATERIMLVQEGEPKFSVLVFSPLFAKGLPATTVAERRMALQGFTVAVLNMEKLLLAALGKTGRLAFPLTCSIFPLPRTGSSSITGHPGLQGAAHGSPIWFPKLPPP